MMIDIAHAAQRLEERGLLERGPPIDIGRVVALVRQQLGQEPPKVLADFYRERIERVGDFRAIMPTWSDHAGWPPMAFGLTTLLPARAVPLFSDGCGSLYGLDLEVGAATPAVYFFDHEREFKAPQWAAGSSLGAFLLLLADGDRAQKEGWQRKWELAIDPELEKCPRAPAIWNTSR
jgi:hypothetical protein